ncbi:MAG: hypothetical protein AB1817_09990, partial [Chloroflexota bacterium]
LISAGKLFGLPRFVTIHSQGTGAIDQYSVYNKDKKQRDRLSAMKLWNSKTDSSDWLEQARRARENTPLTSNSAELLRELRDERSKR